MRTSIAGGVFLPISILLGGLAGSRFGNVSIGVLSGVAAGLVLAGLFSLWNKNR